MSDGYAFRSDAAQVMAWWDDAEQGQTDFYEKVRAFETAHGDGRRAILLSGFGTHVGGLEPREGDPPEGWRLVPSTGRIHARLIPLRRSKAGKALYKEMDEIRVGDPRFNLPGWEWNFGRGMPGLFLHDGAVWMNPNSVDGIDPDVWEPVRLSQFHLAKEAHDAEVAASSPR